MTKAELSQFRKAHETKQAELAGILRRGDEIVIEKSADILDEMTCAAGRDLAVRNLDLESTALRTVMAALQRIADGAFGVCTQCEKEISPGRLSAVPWAPFCIACQERIDQQEQRRVGRSRQPVDAWRWQPAWSAA